MQLFLCLSVVLGVLSSTCSAGNLKGSTLTEQHVETLTNSPEDLKKSRTIAAFKEHIDAHRKRFSGFHKDMRKAVAEQSKALSTLEHQPKMVDVELKDLHLGGWGIERIRPNTDCSGKVLISNALLMGKCQSDEPGTSFLLGCDSSKDKVKIRQVFYPASETCQGEYQVYKIHDDEYNMDKCSLISLHDVETLKEYGHVTAGYQCSDSDTPEFDGYQINFWRGQECEDKPDQVVTYRNACWLEADNDAEVPSFQYFKATCDKPTQQLTFKYYKDPECDSGMTTELTLPMSDVFPEYHRQCFEEDEDEFLYGFCQDGTY